MKTIKLTNDFEISRIVHGHWRLADWNINNQELLKLTQQCIELGITTFDHADIYGNYSCEKLFGDALELKPTLRKDIQLITKCGIKLTTDKFPTRQLNHYDYSYNHIVSSVENSLNNFQTDYIDVLLLHRPSPFFNPEEVAKAFSYLKKSGKVLHFGVSNFTPQQFETLAANTDEELVTNQVEISPLCLEHFNNGNIDYLLQKNIKPMAWSPLAGGQLFNPSTEKEERIFNTLTNIANELDINSIDKLIYSWLLMHPAAIIPVVGTHKIERIKNAVEALDIEMSLEQWFQIYTASTGAGVP
ncbi:aldo/keto reductase family oxidoreductase [uncultured Lutibacter sp.]|uniref:aldo/keto reductase n=1 Tax=uncultured Lutibacter sp. TaxID=437739 RepID=UPI002618112A|nr:aldo/keto reductase [uncultured Lutibacter sp.]